MKLSMVAQDPAYPTRRRWPRFSVELPVRIHRHLPPGVHEARGANLNAGGMSVHTEAPLRVGDQITIEFTPPDSPQPVRVRSFVRNCCLQGYGIEFITECDADYCTVGGIECELSRLAATLQ